MNWKVSRLVQVSKADLQEADGHCGHVTVGAQAWRSSENDAFGIVAAFYSCNECEEARVAREEEEIYTCHDCGCEFPLKEGKQWKTWDHDPSAGDEPLDICGSCMQGEKHLERVRRDRADYELECDSDENY